jgi:hypothetical protein
LLVAFCTQRAIVRLGFLSAGDRLELHVVIAGTCALAAVVVLACVVATFRAAGEAQLPLVRSPSTRVTASRRPLLVGFQMMVAAAVLTRAAAVADGALKFTRVDLRFGAGKTKYLRL